MSHFPIAPALSVNPNDLALTCPLESGVELVVTNTGDSDLHLQGISAPDWLEVTPADPNVILQL